MKRNKNMRVRVNARIASKVREKDLIDKARAIMDDPQIVLPDCARPCGSCQFKKTKVHLERVAKFKDDPVKLAKLAKKGDRLARACAATIGLVHEEKAPYLASAKYPTGTVMFALRGRTSKEMLIGVQNFDSPKWRVLSVIDLVKKKGLHFYSYDDEFICTGTDSNPPEEYIEDAARAVGATRHEADSYLCPHISSETDRIEFGFINSKSEVVVCAQCGAKNKNTLSVLAEGMAVPNILHEFEITIRRPVKILSGNENLEDVLFEGIDNDLLDKYSSGEIGDKELMERHMDNVRDALEKRSERMYIIGSKCFGHDVDSFVAEMTEDEVEADSLKGLIKGITHPLIVAPGTTVNSLLSRYWSEHGLNALKAVVPDKVAGKLYKDDDETVASPMKLIRQAIKKAEHDEVKSQIPAYEKLSQYAKFTDDTVRAYKTKGGAGANAVLDADTSNDHRMRSIAHAFYLAMGVSTKSWKFTNEELEFGKHLSGFADKLLKSDGIQEHHEALARFMKEAGSTEELKRI